jgi:5-formyltetrahydrofolate cyclo-ligase
LSAPGIFGFDEPVGTPADLREAQLILIPATAVDQAGNRLGKGKGFYDIALANPEVTAPIAAVVYEPELIDELPVENHDQPVNFIVTPLRTIAVGS